MRVAIAVLALGACEAARDPAPAAKPPVVAAPANACPASKPDEQSACGKDMLTCTYGKWSCVCAAWVTMGTPDNHRWYCSSCVRPDTSKPCTPGDSCVQRNIERDESFTCQPDGTWTCSSSSSNSAACAGMPRK